MRNRYSQIFICLNAWILLFFMPAAAVSSGAGSSTNEIDHLIRFIQASDCEFIRNDKSYPAAEAVKHILFNANDQARQFGSLDGWQRFTPPDVSVYQQIGGAI